MYTGHSYASRKGQKQGEWSSYSLFLAITCIYENNAYMLLYLSAFKHHQHKLLKVRETEHQQQQLMQVGLEQDAATACNLHMGTT